MRTRIYGGVAGEWVTTPPMPMFRKMNACDQKQIHASSGSGISRAFRVGTIVIAAVLVHVGARDVGFFEPKGSDE